MIFPTSYNPGPQLLKQEPRSVTGTAIVSRGLIATCGRRGVALGTARNGATGGEEQDLDSEGEPRVERDDEHQQNLAGLTVGGAEDRIQVAQEEGDREAEADADEDPVEDGDGRPADKRDGDPDQVRVPVQRPALEQVGRLAAEVAQRAEEEHGDHERVAIDKAGGACKFRS